MRMFTVFAVAVTLWSGASRAQGEEPSRSFNRDADFERFTKPLADDAQRAIRVLTLSNVLACSCRGSSRAGPGGRYEPPTRQTPI